MFAKTIIFLSNNMRIIFFVFKTFNFQPVHITVPSVTTFLFFINEEERCCKFIKSLNYISFTLHVGLDLFLIRVDLATRKIVGQS